MGRSQRAVTSNAAQQSAQAAIALAVGTAAAAQLAVRSAAPLGSLWAGYGSITEVETEEGELLIIKEVAPPPSGSGISHRRKLQSYRVEACFYATPGGVAARLPPGAACHLPRCLGVHSTLGSEGSSGGGGGGIQLVMADLRPQFPNRCGGLDERKAKAALSWLAAFHAACWGADAERLGLWPEACYWHLATRQDELAEMGRDWRQLQAAAPELDRRLRESPWRTLCHGDFKTENILFSGGGGGGSSSLQCAAYDFQYVGGGCGPKDVVYLLCSGVQARLLQAPADEEALLRHYHSELVSGLAATAAAPQGGGSVGCPAAAARALDQYSFEVLGQEYRLAMCDYVRFMAGWGFWGSAASWAAARARQFLPELGLAD